MTRVMIDVEVVNSDVAVEDIYEEEKCHRQHIAEQLYQILTK